MSTYFLALRGTAEVQGSPHNLLYRGYQAATVPLSYVDIPYPASISLANEHQDLFGTSLDVSVQEGLQSLTDHIRAIRSNSLDARIIVAGYSLGCVVLLAGIRDSEYLRKNIDRVILLANPGNRSLPNMGGRRRVRQPFVYDGIVSGLMSDEIILDAGMRDAYQVNWTWDPIPNLHPKSPLRSVAPFLWALDLDDLPQWFGYIRAELDRKVAWAWLRFWEPGYRDAAGEAISDLLRYAKLGHHTTAYTDPDNFSWGGSRMSGIEVVGRLASSETWIND